ncbi:MAG TPA: prepilin peptidase [Candidatus Acidoferrales bacterium]|nr:prepilin peptidase [Candidatus Acidoferrales bacterium]
MWQIQGVIPKLAIDIFVFCFGLIIGSFLNVCILRIPEHKSIVFPSSACPKCGAKIRPYDNIPVLSWLFLGGKCRDCKSQISPMYPLVELLTGVLLWGCYRSFGLTVEALKWATFSAIVVVLVFTDLRERILPDVVNFTGFAVGVAFSLAIKPADGTAAWIATHAFNTLPPIWLVSLADALLGAAIGAALLWVVSELYFRLRRREGMGMGDVKMMLMVGAFLGIKRTLLTIFAGSLLGSVLGIAFILSRRKNPTYELPFGTFLGMAALLVAFFGTPVVNWYQSLVMGR